ncbi:MAG: hypothetical protein GY906_23820 [bacterium]|nr:hypothetical protein [bacterium]
MENPEAYLEYLEGDPRRALTMDLDLEQCDYVHLDEEWEHGLHEGQADSPETVAESLRKLGVERFIFAIDGVGQFDCHFSVWVHESEVPKVIGRDSLESVPPGPSPAEKCKRALQEASIALNNSQG